jgi:dihydroorotase
MLYDMPVEYGQWCRVNPPLRTERDVKQLREYLKGRMINCISPDHAPHSSEEKTGKVLDANGKPMYMSGFPVLPVLPHLIKLLQTNGFTQQEIDDLTHNNACSIFGLEVPNRRGEPNYNLHTKYNVDVWGPAREFWKNSSYKIRW